MALGSPEYVGPTPMEMESICLDELKLAMWNYVIYARRL